MSISRHDYMQDSARLHQAYMMQFATPEVLELVRTCNFYNAILRSIDKHLNDIPLAKWEGLMLNPPSTFIQQLEQLGEWNTPSMRVCVAKAAARSIKEAVVANYHVIKVTYLGATNRLGSRIKLTSERFEKDSVTLCRDHSCNSSLEQAVDLLSQCEFAIVGTAEGRGCYYIITSSFKRLTRG